MSFVHEQLIAALEECDRLKAGWDKAAEEVAELRGRLMEFVGVEGVDDPDTDFQSIELPAKSNRIRMEKVEFDGKRHKWGGPPVDIPTDELYQEGDVILCWVNEADFIRNRDL